MCHTLATGADKTCGKSGSECDSSRIKSQIWSSLEIFKGQVKLRSSSNNSELTFNRVWMCTFLHVIRARLFISLGACRETCPLHKHPLRIPSTDWTNAPQLGLQLSIESSTKVLCNHCPLKSPKPLHPKNRLQATTNPSNMAFKISKGQALSQALYAQEMEQAGPLDLTHPARTAMTRRVHCLAEDGTPYPSLE